MFTYKGYYVIISFTLEMISPYNGFLFIRDVFVIKGFLLHHMFIYKGYYVIIDFTVLRFSPYNGFIFIRDFPF